MVLDYQVDDAFRSLDQEQTLKRDREWAVIDAAGGSNLVTAGAGNYEYDAAAGDINAGGSIVTCSQETVDFVNDVDADDDQIAVIYRDATGTLQKDVGTTGTRNPAGDDVRSTFEPPPNTLNNTDAVILAEVLLPAGASSIGASELRDRRDASRILATGTETLSGGSTPALDTTLVDVLSTQDRRFGVRVYVDADPSFDADYAFNFDYGLVWDDSDSAIDINLTVTWDTDPGGGNDVTARWEVYA